MNRTVLQPQTSESVDSVGSVYIPSSKTRRHSMNPATIPDFFRRVSIGPIGRRMSVRSGRRKSRSPSSTSQPHLHETLGGRVCSPASGLDRTKSVSGTFFRRTQRTTKTLLFHSFILTWSDQNSVWWLPANPLELKPGLY